MKFINPQNDYIEERVYPSLWAFLFGALYFIYIGIWRHAFILLIIDNFLFLTLVKSNSIFLALALLAGHAFYIFNAENFVRQKYLSTGWKEIKEQEIQPNNRAKCPVCDTPLHKGEIQCRFCKSNSKSYETSTDSIPPDLKEKERLFFIIFAVGLVLFLLGRIF